jgi:hypothetical protein
MFLIDSDDELVYDGHAGTTNDDDDDDDDDHSNSMSKVFTNALASNAPTRKSHTWEAVPSSAARMRSSDSTFAIDLSGDESLFAIYRRYYHTGECSVYDAQLACVCALVMLGFVCIMIGSYIVSYSLWPELEE